MNTAKLSESEKWAIYNEMDGKRHTNHKSISTLRLVLFLVAVISLMFAFVFLKNQRNSTGSFKTPNEIRGPYGGPNGLFPVIPGR